MNDIEFMGEKITIYPETLSDGGIEFEIKIKDRSLFGKKATFSIKREVFVKDSRPIHHSVDLRKITFTASASQNRASIIPVSLFFMESVVLGKAQI